jgi:hypothetical protein
MKRFNRLAFAFTLGAAALSAGQAWAETRVTYKSAKSTSSYYQMAVQLAEAVKKGSGGEMILTVEESQGSVQNVKEAATRGGNYVFTTPPGLIKLAQGGKKMFEPKNAKFDEIRGLFPIPSLTMHFVVRKDSGVNSFADLEGKTFLIGKGQFRCTRGCQVSRPVRARGQGQSCRSRAVFCGVGAQEQADRRVCNGGLVSGAQRARGGRLDGRERADPV